MGTAMESAIFKLNMRVRDYECDIQGVVNNSVYMNYLEVARHEFLLAQQVDFVALAKEGIHLMLAETCLQYKASLVPQDNFYVTVCVEPEGRLKIVFVQNIYREDGTLMLTSRNVGLTVKNGRPIKPVAELVALLDKAPCA